jgi:MerR family mercuric resistance operon transcriptional regulator
MVNSAELRSLSIGKLAAAGGVGAETIRFYQRLGLLETPTRGGGIRRYGARDVRRLRFIRRAQMAGLTLSEIKEILELDSIKDRSRAGELAEALDVKIGDLQRLRDALRRLENDGGSGNQGLCPIIDAFGEL